MEQPKGQERASGDSDLAWVGEVIRRDLWLCEQLDFAPLTPDIEFVAFLRTLSQFGFFRFGPITIDVNIVEDILLRTHPRGQGGPEHPPTSSDYIRFGNFGWELMKRTGRRSADELQRLLEFMRWGEGLPQRVFGELGVSAEDVENFVAELSSGAAAPAVRRPKLYSTEEAAEYLGVHIQTVRAWIRSGKLPASRLAGQKSIRIREPDLEAVLEPIDPNHLDD